MFTKTEIRAALHREIPNIAQADIDLMSTASYTFILDATPGERPELYCYRAGDAKERRHYELSDGVYDVTEIILTWREEFNPGMPELNKKLRGNVVQQLFDLANYGER